MALESVPFAVIVLEDISFIMPVSLVPGPAKMGKSSFGNTPVMLSAIIPSVPDTFTSDPLPSDGWWFSMLTPVAYFHMTWVFLYKVEAFFLSRKNVSILPINCCLGFAKVFLVRIFICSHMSVKLSIDLVFFVSLFFEIKKRRLVVLLVVFAFSLKILSLLSNEAIILIVNFVNLDCTCSSKKSSSYCEFHVTFIYL